MARYCKITDGTTTINLDGTSAADFFDVLWGQWSPNVARMRHDVLGGELYEHVTEDIPLKVKSTTDIATVLANIEELNKLIEQAGRWWKGENVDAVVLRYSANSASDYLEAAIIGTPDNSPAIELPQTFEGLLFNTEVIGLRLRLVRRGQWLDDEDTASGSTVAQGVKGSVTFSATPDVASPVKVTVTPDSSSLPEESTFLFAQNSADIEIDDLGSNASTYALGGFVALTATSSTPGTATSSENTLSGNMPANRVACYGTIKTSRDVMFRVGLRTISGGNLKYTSWTLIEDASYIKPIYFGTISFPEGTVYSYVYEFQYTNTTNLEMDYFAFFNASNMLNTALRYLNNPGGSTALTIDNRLLTYPNPTVKFSSQYAPYLGTPMIYAENQILYYAQIGTGDSNDRQPNSTPDAAENYEYSFAMRPGNLIPQ